MVTSGHERIGWQPAVSEPRPVPLDVRTLQRGVDNVGMAGIRLVLRWVFVRGPAAFYELGESSPGVLSILVLVALAGAAGLGAGIGALIALVTASRLSPAVDTGVLTGFLVLLGWMVMSLVVVGVLWVRGVSPAEAYRGRASGRHAAGSVGGWRRRGDALVPASLVGFFALVAVIFGAIGLHAWQVSRPWSEATAVVDGVVVAYHEPGLAERGAGTVIVRYTVHGSSYTLEIDADTGDRVIREGDTVPVEYAINRPARARAVWTVEAGRTDTPFWVGLSGLCAVLGAASGVGYLVGRRRWRRAG
jgi:hypothetical protein